MTTGTKALHCQADCTEHRSAAAGIRGRMKAAWARLATMRRVAVERRALAELDDSQLRDMGISGDARRRELRRPFWDI